jgi:ABC-type nitrate/sulfonate/bicarbonate transport system permease component
VTAFVATTAAPFRKRRAQLPWRGLALPIGLAIALEALARTTGFESESVPLPSQVITAFVEAILNGAIFQVTLESLSAAFGGLAIGATIGLILGIVFGVFPLVFWTMELTTEVIRPIPSVALIPLALMIFGFGYTMEISLVAKSTIWPIMFISHAAVSNIDRRLIEVSRLLQLGPIDVVRKIIVPAIMPAIFVGFRLSMSVAILVTIAIEIAVNPRGIGYAMMRAEETMQLALLFALLFWIGLLGWGINTGLERIQRTFFDYAPTVRGDA